MEQAEELLRELYVIHDFFFTADPAEKQHMMKELVDRITPLVAAVDAESNGQARAKALYIHGKALDALNPPSPEVESMLSRAVKLDPTSVDAWNALGHCYWKRGDLAQAASCFTESKTVAPNPTALQNLSMLKRQMMTSGMNSQQIQEAIEASVALAKEALALDVDSSYSWYVLGNAYTAKFFQMTKSVDDVNKALRAYRMADAKGGSANPDLFYNRGKVERYLQEYSAALASFNQAAAIDPSLGAQAQVEEIETWLQRLCDLQQRKGRVKAKRILHHVESTGAYMAAHELPPGMTLKAACTDLAVGANRGVCVYGKALLTCTKGDTPPECFLWLDSSGEVCILSVYHLGTDAAHRILSSGSADDVTLCIMEPSAKDMQVSPDHTLRFIQVFMPSQLLVNGEPVQAEAVAPEQFSVRSFDS